TDRGWCAVGARPRACPCHSSLRSVMSNPRLAQNYGRPSPFKALAARVGEIASAFWRAITKDMLSTVLALASIILAITFFSFLGSLGPQGEGQKVALSNLTALASAQRLQSATLLDHDHQVVAHTDTGLQIYASYPSSDAATASLYRTLTSGGAQVQVDLQSSKPARAIVVQFLIPILLLVCLFAFFTRQTGDASGGIASFSAFRGKGRKRKKGASPITFDSVAGAGEAVAELREIR